MARRGCDSMCPIHPCSVREKQEIRRIVKKTTPNEDATSPGSTEPIAGAPVGAVREEQAIILLAERALRLVDAVPALAPGVEDMPEPIDEHRLGERDPSRLRLRLGEERAHHRCAEEDRALLHDAPPMRGNARRPARSAGH